MHFLKNGAYHKQKKKKVQQGILNYLRYIANVKYFYFH